MFMFIWIVFLFVCCWRFFRERFQSKLRIRVSSSTGWPVIGQAHDSRLLIETLTSSQKRQSPMLSPLLNILCFLLTIYYMNEIIFEARLYVPDWIVVEETNSHSYVTSCRWPTTVSWGPSCFGLSRVFLVVCKQLSQVLTEVILSCLANKKDRNIVLPFRKEHGNPWLQHYRHGCRQIICPWVALKTSWWHNFLFHPRCPLCCFFLGWQSRVVIAVVAVVAVFMWILLLLVVVIIIIILGSYQLLFLERDLECLTTDLDFHCSNF